MQTLTQDQQTSTEDFDFTRLSLGAEELESLDVAWDWGDFFGGVAIGVGGAGVVAGGIGIGIAIT